MTRKELICIASASGVSFYGMGKDRERFMDCLQRFADIVAEGTAFAEREACAKVVDHILKEGGGTWGDAIRARGQA